MEVTLVRILELVSTECPACGFKGSRGDVWGHIKEEHPRLADQYRKLRRIAEYEYGQWLEKPGVASGKLTHIKKNGVIRQIGENTATDEKTVPRESQGGFLRRFFGRYLLIAACIIASGCASPQVMREEMTAFAQAAGETDRELRDEIMALRREIEELKAAKANIQEGKTEAASVLPVEPTQRIERVEINPVVFPKGKKDVLDLPTEHR
jgi:hypothetical protein